MKASYEAVPIPEGRSFLIRPFDIDGFKAPFHYHPEYELTLIVEGSGSRFVGTHMARFNSGDLMLIGTNIPHCWKLDRDCKKASSIVIQFKYDFLGESFMSAPEMNSVKAMLENNTGGWVISGILRQHITANIQNLVFEENPFLALMKLLHSLSIISRSDEIQLLSTSPISATRLKADNDRILPIYEYIQTNFNKKIELGHAAALLNMNPNAFCKLFKRITRKTFIETVTDYRVGLAIQLLTTSGLPVSQVAFESGFADDSNFFKAFKKRTGYSPLKYRIRYREGLPLKEFKPFD